MDKTLRSILGGLAEELNMSLKSSCAGDGNPRQQMLTRTDHTVKCSEEEFNEHFSRIVGKHATSLQKRKGKAKEQGAEATGNAAGVQIEVDMVDRHPLEIGQNNKGRRMLEKMGWRKGTGLGCLDNKGILEPIMPVIRDTKSGLG
jgi:hypothetical protein